MHFVIDIQIVDFDAIRRIKCHWRIAVTLYGIVRKKSFVFQFSTFKIQINFFDVIVSIMQFLLLKLGQCLRGNIKSLSVFCQSLIELKITQTVSRALVPFKTFILVAFVCWEIREYCNIEFICNFRLLGTLCPVPASCIAS